MYLAFLTPLFISVIGMVFLLIQHEQRFAEKARLPYPVPTLGNEAHCFSCHANRYRFDGVKGAVNIGMPLRKPDAILESRMGAPILSLTASTVASALIALVMIVCLSRRLSREIRKNIEREKLAVVVELGGTMAREMHRSMTAVHCILDAAAVDASRGGELTLTAETRNMIRRQCSRMNMLIDRLLEVKDHGTVPYSEGIRMPDIEASSTGVRRRSLHRLIGAAKKRSETGLYPDFPG